MTRNDNTLEYVYICVYVWKYRETIRSIVHGIKVF